MPAVRMLLVTATLLLAGCAAERAAPPSLAERTGIEIEGVRLSAAGYMLDFRYRVVDAEKAAAIVRPGIKPYLVVEANGSRLETPAPPKIGPLRQTRSRIIENRQYFVFFANPGRMVKAGEEVTVVLGDVRAERLIVK